MNFFEIISASLHFQNNERLSLNNIFPWLILLHVFIFLKIGDKHLFNFVACFRRYFAFVSAQRHHLQCSTIMDRPMNISASSFLLILSKLQITHNTNCNSFNKKKHRFNKKKYRLSGFYGRHQTVIFIFTQMFS